MIVQFLKWEMTCSIIQRILLTWALYSFCQSSSSPPFGFFERRYHVVADIAFVSRPVPGVHCQEHARFAHAVVVVAASADGIRDPGELSLLQFLVARPCPSRGRFPVDGVLGFWVQVVSSRNIFGCGHGNEWCYRR